MCSGLIPPIPSSQTELKPIIAAIQPWNFSSCWCSAYIHSNTQLEESNILLYYANLHKETSGLALLLVTPALFVSLFHGSQTHWLTTFVEP